MYIHPKEKHLLKTKIVATIGEEREDIFDLTGKKHEEKIDYETLFQWFRQPYKKHLMIDIIRLNMSFLNKSTENNI
jgi:lipoate synthase